MDNISFPDIRGPGAPRDTGRIIVMMLCFKCNHFGT